MSSRNYPNAFLHPFSNLATLAESGPVIVDRGAGIYIFDDQGNRYIEANSGLWNAVLGFDNAELIAAAQRAYAKLPVYHAFFGRVAQSALDLSEQLVKMAPMEAGKVFYANSGSEANDTVVKLLWFLAESEGKPHRRILLSRRNAYHGMTVVSASLTGKDYVKSASGLPIAEVRHLSSPHHWREAKPGESEEAFSLRLADELEQTIRNIGADYIAGFFAEPVMGAGGVIPPPRGYFSAMQPVLKKYGIPFIADEVICGFGRTGEFWGSIKYDIKPDIVVASKVITAGFFPMGAVILSTEMADRVAKASAKYGQLPTGFTTGAHPVGCAIAIAVLKQLLDGGSFKAAQAACVPFQAALRAMADHPLIGEARGVGLMGALEIVADKETKVAHAPALDVSERIARQALRNGLICRPLGPAIVLAPPFIIEEGEIAELFRLLRLTLDEVHRDLR
ncbi:aminotransferase [Dongia sp. agr-C8]